MVTDVNGESYKVYINQHFYNQARVVFAVNEYRQFFCNSFSSCASPFCPFSPWVTGAGFLPGITLFLPLDESESLSFRPFGSRGRFSPSYYILKTCLYCQFTKIVN